MGVGKMGVGKMRVGEMGIPHNLDPLKLHFYIVKQGFTEIYIIFLNLALKQTMGTL